MMWFDDVFEDDCDGVGCYNDDVIDDDIDDFDDYYDRFDDVYYDNDEIDVKYGKMVRMMLLW